jgi:hypothetical protein
MMLWQKVTHNYTSRFVKLVLVFCLCTSLWQLPSICVLYFVSGNIHSTLSHSVHLTATAPAVGEWT